MDTLYCFVSDFDKFSSEVLKNFIKKTAYLELVTPSKKLLADVYFVDSDIDKENLTEEMTVDALFIVVSANQKHITSLFKDEITDFLYKPDLNYTRFLKAIELVRKKRRQV